MINRFLAIVKSKLVEIGIALTMGDCPMLLENVMSPTAAPNHVVVKNFANSHFSTMAQTARSGSRRRPVIVDNPHQPRHQASIYAYPDGDRCQHSEGYADGFTVNAS